MAARNLRQASLRSFEEHRALVDQIRETIKSLKATGAETSVIQQAVEEAAAVEAEPHADPVEAQAADSATSADASSAASQTE